MSKNNDLSATQQQNLRQTQTGPSVNSGTSSIHTLPICQPSTPSALQHTSHSQTGRSIAESLFVSPSPQRRAVPETELEIVRGRLAHVADKNRQYQRRIDELEARLLVSPQQLQAILLERDKQISALEWQKKDEKGERGKITKLMAEAYAVGEQVKEMNLSLQKRAEVFEAQLAYEKAMGQAGKKQLVSLTDKLASEKQRSALLEAQLKAQKELTERVKEKGKKALEKKGERIEKQFKEIERLKTLTTEMLAKKSSDADRIRELKGLLSQSKGSNPVTEPVNSTANSGMKKGKGIIVENKKEIAKKEKSEKRRVKEAVGKVWLDGLGRAIYELVGDGTPCDDEMSQLKAALDVVREATKEW